MTHQLDLLDTMSGTRITGKRTFDEALAYLKQRELGRHLGTVCHNMDGSITVSATDKKGHLITGQITRLMK